jgi:hypothetical protein
MLTQAIHFKIETSFNCKSYLKYLRIYIDDRNDIMKKLFNEFNIIDIIGTSVDHNITFTFKWRRGLI